MDPNDTPPAKGPVRQDREMPSLTALRAFDALCRMGSVTLAAADLKVTPGAISRQIRGLEAALGVLLFDRAGGRLSLTPAGRAYERQIDAAFNRIETATQALTADLRSNELIISCTPSFHLCWLLARLPAFEAAHSHIRVIVHTALSTHERETRPDAIIGVGYWPADDTLVQRKIMDNISGPVMAPGFLPALATEGPPFAAIRHLRLRADPGIWPEWYRDAGVEEAPDARDAAMDHLFLTIEAARAGLGAAIAPYSYVAEDIRTGRLVAPYGFLERSVPYYIAWPALPAPKPALAAFVAWLQAEGRKTPVPPKGPMTKA